MTQSYYHNATLRTERAGKPRSNENLIHEPTLWRCLLLAALTYLVWSDKISIVLDFGSPQVESQLQTPPSVGVKASFLTDVPRVSGFEPARERAKASVRLPASATGHATFILDPTFASRNKTDSRSVASSTSLCADYVQRFAPIAVAEMKKYGIPASVTLAQGILESNAGDGLIAKRTNNHFGIKCFSNKCKNGHCSNFTDNSHKDFFVRYGNVWSSYRAHSLMLKNNRRYAHLFGLAANDFRGWALGLEKAGYATDPQYAEKILAIIQNMELHVFDQPEGLAQSTANL
ncbi:MAG: glucosaminidase domain-containing protein [Saprospiraceae bacterium]